MSLLWRSYQRPMAVTVGILLILLCGSPANATHKNDHRFTVWGEIKYEDGTPAAEIVVHLMVKDGAPMGEVKTDKNGRYRLVLHVHNEDVYKVFDMRVNNVTRKVRLLFSPHDLQTERGQRVDLVVKRQGEFETSGIQTQ
ncbi:MAG: hypothetical protein GWP74_11700 [Proteobacteria bacterium]|nr:hypothetical protein [Pseudomonadota bacterium]